MVNRYFFLVNLALLLSLMGWWSKSIESSSGAPGWGPVSFQSGAEAAQGARAPAAGSEEKRVGGVSHRRELLEILDRVVVYEHYYHSVYGHFTKLLNRIGFQVPQSIASVYEIRVAEASSQRLLVTALSEVDGKTIDLVSIDQDYRIHSNFPLPPPRPDYLKLNALRHLRQLKEAPAGQVIEEQGVFRGYFKYELRRDSEDRRVAFAVGVRAPVQGIQLEAGAGVIPSGESPFPMEETGFGVLTGQMTGQSPVGEVVTGTDQAYLAQRIFLGEVGRYARSWSELSRIANFQFPERMVAQDSQMAVPLPAPEGLEKHLSDSEGLKSGSQFRPDSLEIEPVSAEENTGAGSD